MVCTKRIGEAGDLFVGGAEIMLVEDAGTVYAPQVDRSSPEHGRWLSYLRRHPWALSGNRGRPVRFRSYLIRTPFLNLLVDAGLDAVVHERSKNLSSGGAGAPAAPAADIAATVSMKSVESAEDVDVVFATHAHPLEAGWAFTAGGEPAFPDARYVAPWVEWEAASPDSRLRRLDGSGLLDLVDGEEELAPGITSIPTPGHSVGHQSLLLSSGGEGALVVGDAFAHPTQIMDPTWGSAQDEDGPKAAWTRIGLVDWLGAGRMTVVAGHFPAPGYGRIVRGRDGRRHWEPVEATRRCGDYRAAA